MSESQHAVLHIIRGRSQFRLRAVDVNPFLIGAGSSCHLQLSSADIPMIYALLRSTPAGVQLEAMHAHPELVVNGAVTRTAVLERGDHIRIGCYEFEFLGQTVSDSDDDVDSPITSQGAPKLQPPLAIAPLTARTAELSAEELVDRIGQELELLEFLEQQAPPLQASFAPRRSA